MKYIIIIMLIAIATPTKAEWYMDYKQAMEVASKSRKNMLVYFNTTGQPDSITRQITQLNTNHILTLVPTNLQASVDGKQIYLIQHSSFAELHGKPGIAIVDYASNAYFGEVVSIYPINSGATISHLQQLFYLPTGSLTQRTLILAVRIHPERPASTNGTMSPILMQEAESHSRHQASINLQGHHNWNSRFNRIVGRMGTRSAQEVCAESWGGMNLFSAAVDCVHSWRQSPGHWGAVRRNHSFFGYDMKRGSNGIWYATGIFSSR